MWNPSIFQKTWLFGSWSWGSFLGPLSWLAVQLPGETLGYTGWMAVRSPFGGKPPKTSSCGSPMSPSLLGGAALRDLSGQGLPVSSGAYVALVGPPNCGKSTLFNRLTGLRQKTANFPGVTVERHHGTVRLSGGKELELLDLPGTYSLAPRSEDERITDDLLRGKMPEVCVPDAVLLVLDSTNLGRHLVLAAPMLALEKPILVVLNMADELRRRGGESGCGGPLGTVGCSGGSGERRQGGGTGRDIRFPGEHLPSAGPVELSRSSRVRPPAGSGRGRWRPNRPIGPRWRPCGPGGWMGSSFIHGWGRWYSWW